MKLVNSVEHKPKLTVEFEPDELDALYAVLMNVGGDTEKTGRRHTKELLTIIEHAGYSINNNPYFDGDFGPTGCDGGIYFTR